MSTCACLDPRVFGHVHPCPLAARLVLPPDPAVLLLAQIRAIQEGQRP